MILKNGTSKVEEVIKESEILKSNSKKEESIKESQSTQQLS
jgi:hypothetical protein